MSGFFLRSWVLVNVAGWMLKNVEQTKSEFLTKKNNNFHI